MSAWETSRELWAEWIARDESVPQPVWISCDELDEDLREILERHPFLGATESTVSTRAPVAPPHDGDLPEAAAASGVFSDVPVSPFRVGLTGGGFEVDLFVDGAAPRDDLADGSPLSIAPAADELITLEGLFIPTLTRSGFVPPAIEPVLVPHTEEALPSSAEDAFPGLVVRDEPDVPEVVRPRSTTVVTGPEPGTPVPIAAELDPSRSQTAGEIVMHDDPAARSLTHGEVPAVARRRKVIHAGLPAEERQHEPELPREVVVRAEVYEDATELDVTELVDDDAEVDDDAPAAVLADHDEESAPHTPVAEPSVGGRVSAAAAPAPAEWWSDVFGEHYAALTRAGHDRLAGAEAEFFLQSSGLAPGARILDLGCGDGAHAIAFAQRGYAVTGLDASADQLARARRSAGQTAIEWVHADMRAPDLTGTFDGVVCFGTTLGYFVDDDEHRQVLAAMWERLEPGGRLLLQVVNRDAVVARLPARSWWQGDGCLVLDETFMNFFSNRIHVHRNVVFEDGRQYEHDMFVRAYTAHDLGKMCVDAGFRVLELSGSRHTRGRFYGATSPEIWLLAIRP